MSLVDNCNNTYKNAKYLEKYLFVTNKLIWLLNGECIYLVDLVGMYVPTRSLRSGNKALLSVPCKPSRKDGHRAFAQCAPVVWNALPLSIREASSISQFKTLLKIHLFTAHEDLN